MAATKKNFLYPIHVELNEDHASSLKLMKPEQDVVKTVQQFATAFLREYCEGGLMLKKAHLDHIEDAAGVKVSLPEEVIQVVTAAKGRGEDGYHYVRVRIDPQFWSNLTDAATASGMTPEDFVATMMDHVVYEGWLYTWRPSGGRINLNMDQWAEVAEIIGSKVISGEELVAKLRELAGKVAPATK
jgi:hypothetical protein